jgi:hypothetical protein
MMDVPIRTEPSFSPGNPKVLFQGSYLNDSSDLPSRFYDVSPDGKRFHMIKPRPRAETFHVVLNRAEELKERVPRNH